MATTGTVTVRMKINPSPFIRSTHDIGTVMRNMTADLRGAPRPPRAPYPKMHSGLTARQYRAERRRYARERRGYAKAMRNWTPNRTGAMAAFANLAGALAKPKGTD